MADAVLDAGKFSSFLASAGIPTPKDYIKDQTALLEKEKAERKPLLDQQKSNIDKMFEYAKQLKDAAPPQAPKLQDVPNAPDVKYQDPTQALGSMASVLALIGSFKTRAPLTAALNSAAAAMDGFHKGDMQRVKLEREKWHDNLERALQQNQIEMQRYTAALEQSKFDMAKARPMFEAIAAENQHTGMLLAAQNSDYKAMHAIYDGGIKVGENMVKMYLKDQEFRLQKSLAAQAHKDTLEQTKALREQTNAIRDQSRKDRLAMFDAQHGTNLSGIAGNAAMPKNEKINREIDDLIEFVHKNPSVVGTAGWVRAPFEAISGMAGTVISGVPFVGKPIVDLIPEQMKMDPLHQNFASMLSKLQADIHSSLIGGGPMTKLKAQYINEIIRGRNVFDTPRGTIDALEMLKSAYGGDSTGGASGVWEVVK